MDKTYYIIENGVIVNAVSCDPTLYAIDPSWIPEESLSSEVISSWGTPNQWSTPDNGVTWNPPINA